MRYAKQIVVWLNILNANRNLSNTLSLATILYCFVYKVITFRLIIEDLLQANVLSTTSTESRISNGIVNYLLELFIQIVHDYVPNPPDPK